MLEGGPAGLIRLLWRRTRLLAWGLRAALGVWTLQELGVRELASQ